ncbi:MAG: 6-bladed beta-propeller [Tannerella sp.]|nr:6-bladed beta-propeller [Tannerella sp.]
MFCRCSGKDEFPHLPVASSLNEAEDVPIEDFASSIRRVQLETNDDILISNISNVLETDEFFIVSHASRLSVFDKDGKYMNDISSKGQGPHEFNDISSIFIKDGLLYLYDASRRAVLIFTFEGEFVRSFSTGKRYSSIFPLRSNDYVAFQRSMSGKEKAKLVFFDESAVSDTIYYDREYLKAVNIVFTFDKEGYVYNCDGEDYFKELYSDTLFTVQPDHTLEPRLIFDLGGYQPTLEWKHAITDVINHVWDRAHLFIIGETSSHLFFNVRMNRETSTCYWDKRRKSLHNARLAYPPDYGYEGAFVPKAVSEDRRHLISVENDTAGDNNPALIIATLKE